MKYRQTKSLLVPDTQLFGFHEPEIKVIARTPLQKQRDADGSQYSRMRPSVLAPKETLYVTPEKVEKGSMVRNLPDYHHPPQTDPCMTVCDYLDSKRGGNEYKTSYSSVFNDPYQSGYGKLSDQPRDPNTNRRLDAQTHFDRVVTETAPRDVYTSVKKCLDSFQDKLSKLIK